MTEIPDQLRAQMIPTCETTDRGVTCVDPASSFIRWSCGCVHFACVGHFASIATLLPDLSSRCVTHGLNSVVVVETGVI